MSEPKSIRDLMLVDENYRKLLGKHKPKSTWITPEQALQAQALWRAGLSMPDMVAKLGVSEVEVRARLAQSFRSIRAREADSSGFHPADPLHESP